MLSEVSLPCALERATDKFLPHLRGLLRKLGKPYRTAITSKFKRLWEIYRRVATSMSHYKDNVASSTKYKAQMSPEITRSTLQKCRKAARLIVVALCVPWKRVDIGNADEVMRKVTTFAVRFAFFLSEVRFIPGEQRKIASAVTAACANRGHFFSERQESHLAFCCGTLAEYCWLTAEESIGQYLESL